MWCGAWTFLKPNTQTMRNNSYLKFLLQCSVDSVLVERLQMNDIWVPKYHRAHTHPPTERHTAQRYPGQK